MVYSFALEGTLTFIKKNKLNQEKKEMLSVTNEEVNETHTKKLVNKLVVMPLLSFLNAMHVCILACYIYNINGIYNASNAFFGSVRHATHYSVTMNSHLYNTMYGKN